MREERKCVCLREKGETEYTVVSYITIDRCREGEIDMRLRRRSRRSDPALLTSSKDKSSENSEVKVAKPVKPLNKASRFIRNIVSNPNFSYQTIVILMTLASDNIPMDRRLDTMNSTVDKVRSMSEMITNTMQSLKVAAETPKKIRRILE